MDKEYISREAAIAMLHDTEIMGLPKWNVALERGAENLKSIPAADVVEVVRCRECIFWEPESTRTRGKCNRSFDIPAWATDFCSYGNRKGGRQDA